MKRLVQWSIGIYFGMLLASVFSQYDSPKQAVPVAESPLFFRTAQAAFWDGWFNETPIDIQFSEMYESVSSLGITMSGKLQNAEGHRVRMVGFMAPPLKPTINFFVLTREPMAICPFCSSDADWPSDIIVVKLSEPVTSLPFDKPIYVTGKLELGTQVDDETGFVSLVRIQADSLEALD